MWHPLNGYNDNLHAQNTRFWMEFSKVLPPFVSNPRIRARGPFEKYTGNGVYSTLDMVGAHDKCYVGST